LNYNFDFDISEVTFEIEILHNKKGMGKVRSSKIQIIEQHYSKCIIEMFTTNDKEKCMATCSSIE
jgi:hypothetical protein